MSFHRVLSAIAAPSSWTAHPVSLEIVSGYVWGLVPLDDWGSRHSRIYYLILGAVAVSSKNCSATCYYCCYWWQFPVDMLFGWMSFPGDVFVYVPSSQSSSSFFIVHVSAPYSRMLSRQALREETLVEVEMPDCQTLRSLLLVFQACPFLARLVRNSPLRG